MRKLTRILLPAFTIFLIACNKPLDIPSVKNSPNPYPVQKKTDSLLYLWHHKDIELDSFPGISLDRAYDSIIPYLGSGKEVIIAVIDMPIDIKHEDLSSNIWTNTNEIPNNGIDDDKNGFIDDVNGWSFISNPDGRISRFVNYEYTRILKKYSKDFSNNNISDSIIYKTYKKAKANYDERMKYAIKDTAYINTQHRGKIAAQKTLSLFFNHTDYSTEDLDSLKKAHPDNKTLQKHIRWMKILMKYGFTNEYIEQYQLKANERLNKLLNTEYNDRLIMGDNPNNISDVGYGSPFIDTYEGFFDHGTKMAGLLAANRKNGIGIKGISDNIRIMPLCISAFGDEHDKDIALAIRYAVDNGAKVINMSFGKEFSLHKQWIFDAIKYAEKHNVLIIKSSGNNGQDVDSFEVYPNDYDFEKQQEITDNFLVVGAINYNANETMVPAFSNYGANNVDIFAPGYKMNTTVASDKNYEIIIGGTSTSCAITSGVAGLLYSYYPNLTAKEVKEIIMNSGLSYEFQVKLNDSLVPFSKLSKSGKVLNAHNALIMADSIAR
ncbi:S8 family serine peptidase [Tenacibaculum xiamenense]|uniref:S8 family serine peptidase n=1 Tax=Tenacibaculum xiamenense TaxID=1261553 RepID=UPI0038B423C5